VSYADILQEAAAIVVGDRRDQYGDPYEMCARVARMWSALFGFEVEAHQVPLAMVLLKVCRESHHHQRDNLVDVAGYAALAHEVAEEARQ
jgi:hypothetical protein